MTNNDRSTAVPSTRAIWRFTEHRERDGVFWILEWPEGAHPLRAEAAMQGEMGVHIWAEVPDVDARRGAKLFQFVPTGAALDANAEYVDTFWTPGGPNNGRWIWHLLHYPGQDAATSDPECGHDHH